MIGITTDRVGVLTKVTAICPSDALAEQVRQIFRSATSRYNTEPGLVVTVTCKGAEAERIADAVAVLSYRNRTAPAQPRQSVPSGNDISGKHRELIQATDMSERTTPKHVFIKGRRLTLTGFGEEFIGREIHGHLWGERVRYAYYSA
jgi:hypothetical protein